MQDIKVTLIQSPLYWENPGANRKMFEKKISEISKPTDIVALPEVFTTGFTMEPSNCAEPHKGKTFQWMKHLAAKNNFVITGSIATEENGKYYNRLIWMEPDGNYYQYDKKHLFGFAGETKNYTPGKDRVVIEYNGWKFLLLICYDLRFPVWCKNNYSPEKGFEYDCILNIANWPSPRSNHWRILLKARAIENQAYMIGVNRIGKDDKGIDHSGDSALIDHMGEELSNIQPFEEKIETITISGDPLYEFRQKLKVAEDWDKFKLLE